MVSFQLTCGWSVSGKLRIARGWNTIYKCQAIPKDSTAASQASLLGPLIRLADAVPHFRLNVRTASLTVTDSYLSAEQKP